MIALIRLALAIVASLSKSTAQLKAENAALRQQLIVHFEVARVSNPVETVSSGICISVLTVLSSPHSAGNSLRVVPFRELELTYPIKIITRTNKVLTPSASRLVAALRDRFVATRPQ